ncbi:hypothetical protein [Parasedimentitalea marina]|uniref:hypothetical protein n=1 Tax=Parasedimentitalea marina TaxID=2483033 RepID=UPI001EE8B329|nr:hypothetical protein [Parasedimentitalea marina]
MFNTGYPALYLAQIAGRSSGVSERLKMQSLDQYCSTIQDPAAKATCETNMAIKRWYKSGNRFDPSYAGRCQQMSGRYQAECKAMLIKDLAIQRRDPSLCALIPKDQWVPQAYCDLHFKPTRQPLPAEIAVSHRQILRSNVLLEWQGHLTAIPRRRAASKSAAGVGIPKWRILTWMAGRTSISSMAPGSPTRFHLPICFSKQR